MISASGQRLAFKQIAGLIARRIVCRLNPGDTVRAGERFGLIRFGSRVDLLLPASTRLDVNVGDKVRGGESIIGSLLTTGPQAEPSPAKEGSDAEL